MKAAAFDYEKPLACDEAIRLVTPTDGMGKFVSGSQSLGPMMNLRLAQPELLVDLRGIAALRETRSDGEYGVIGACVTHAEIEDGAIEDFTQGLMAHVARGIAYRAVRNRGTLGGSLAHADPAADWINVMCALAADFLVAGPGGERVVASADWMAGAFTTALEADEILTGVRIRRLSDTARWSYYKFNRKPGEFAEAIAVFIDDARAGICRAVIGAIDAPPCLIANARALVDDPSPALLDPCLTGAGLEPGTYEYQVHRVALMRAAATLREHGRNPQ
ncbi:Carbon monoxide dehydrogenase medium chain [Caballeronia glathei]|jgi:carbon-monoxide dehydrogenase medium subunit|uniref:Carbon monoxide dehydrogenase n=1 Tax=Caballeronia glathei TaxID=60547 RepID=A0A069PXG9_9BURK|nr:MULTISPECIES: FAD binding domain-containing protein [Burkholderiaceae]KDR42086.1 carbon monoxide dehydrogenase [Caballeronia glathei]TCK34857.1 carbon-monoxide dehydrogenase medium subunit [Paraburkholderia sp. BL8N3]CDY77654.1 Carbon monoxide dehydrogenase medium chain [Caballeronia glathei]